MVLHGSLDGCTLLSILCFTVGVGEAFQAPSASTYGLTPPRPGRDGRGKRAIPLRQHQRVDAARRAHDDWYIEEDASDHSFKKSGAFENTEDESSIAQGAEKSDDIRQYFATCIPGLHDTLASELKGLGAAHVETQGKSGVRFEGTPQLGLKSILWCRTAHKIMELIASSSDPNLDDGFDFDYQSQIDFSLGIRDREDLYQFTRSTVHTPTLLGDGSGGLLTLSVGTIFASKAPKELCHGHFTALTVKNALVDAVRDLREEGDRPNVDVEDADLPLVVVIRGRSVGGRRMGRREREESEHIEVEEEFVADVDLYRCLHSAGSLHRRGYRQANLDFGWEEGEQELRGKGKGGGSHGTGSTNSNALIHRAAMKESLAAGLLIEAGFDKLVNAARGDGKGAVLVDCMTGSGTLAIEASLIACDVAPGLLRIASWREKGGKQSRNPHRVPPCVRWKDFTDVATWDDLLAKATLRSKSGMQWARSPSEFVQKNVSILCNERDPRATGLAQTSIRGAGVSSIVSLRKGDCIDWNLGGRDSTNSRPIIEGRTIFVCNPPWGLRLTEDIDQSWVSLREFLRREAYGCEAWVLSGNKDLTKILRMKKSRSVVIQTADEDLRWLQYHIFQRKGLQQESGLESACEK